MEAQKKNYSSKPSNARYKTHHQPLPENILYEVYNQGGRRLSRISSIKLFLLSLLGGGFMCLASLVSTLLITDVTSAAGQYVLQGLGLTLGLLLVILTNAVLFTEANIFIPYNFYKLTLLRGCLRLFRFWLISWIGNVIGAFFIAYLIYLCQEYSDTFRQNLMHTTSLLLNHSTQLNYRTTGELLISGMIANWIIALISFFAIASRNLINQCILIFLGFIFIAASHLQYFLTNLGYFSLNTFFVKSIHLSDAFFYNLIPVSLGNILGAAIFVAGPLLYFSKKRFNPR